MTKSLKGYNQEAHNPGYVSVEAVTKVLATSLPLATPAGPGCCTGSVHSADANVSTPLMRMLSSNTSTTP